MLEGKVAIITGGTRGIGFATAQTFLKNKAKVIIFGSKKESVDRAVSTLKEENPDYIVEGYAPKLENQEEIKDVFAKRKEEYKQIDILVNNAGISSSTELEAYKEEEIEKIININIKGVFNCSMAVVPYMKEEGGVLLHTSSMVSLYGQARGCLYPASKFAVNGITKSLARELGKYKIRVNAVAPGVIETDMVKSLKKEMIEPLIATIPLGRMGKPEDIALSFLFLASDMASYISGAILEVDGATIC